MKTQSNFTFKPLSDTTLLERLCMGFNVSFALSQMSSYIDADGNPTSKAIRLFEKNIKNRHKSPLFLEPLPTFKSNINIAAKIKSSIDLAGVEYYESNGIFHYTISLYAALVLSENQDLGFELRNVITRLLEQQFSFILKIWKEYQSEKVKAGEMPTEAELELYKKHSIIRRPFQIEIPFFIANQLKRHVQGLTFTEVSFRYSDSQKVFYVSKDYAETGLLPKVGETKRQGRGKGFTKEKFSQKRILELIDKYYEANKSIIAPEVCRNILPQCTFTILIASMTDTCAARLCNLRLDEHAQLEFQVYAKQIRDYYITICPEFDHLMEVSKKKN
jgi:hypothetical protein